ncbi:hypothetical protein AYI69_g10053 [Smittium culicis]|uniref:Importin N-terminal domain-containing protein n=1 Tax=Smittium culicis TaxID=133412 RepID=A0A1R1X8G8_9FUNG|nr:hypothetical protein AYI69_g10053 [Smittium culicis]
MDTSNELAKIRDSINLIYSGTSTNDQRIAANNHINSIRNNPNFAQIAFELVKENPLNDYQTRYLGWQLIQDQVKHLGLENSTPPETLLSLVQNSLKSFHNSFSADYLIFKAADVTVSLALRLWPRGIWSDFPTWIIFNLSNDLLVLRIIQSIGEEILEYQSEPIVTMRKLEYTSGITVAFLPLFIINQLYPDGFKLDQSNSNTKKLRATTYVLELIKPLEGNENGWIGALFTILNDPAKPIKVRETAINALQAYLNWLPFTAFENIPQIISTLISFINNTSAETLIKPSLNCLLSITSRNYPSSVEKQCIAELFFDQYKIYNQLNSLLVAINSDKLDLEESDKIELTRMIFKIPANIIEILIFYKKSSSPLPKSINEAIKFMIHGLTSNYVTVSEISASSIFALNNNQDQVKNINPAVFSELQPIIIDKIKSVFSLISSKNDSIDWEDESDGIFGGNFESINEYKTFVYGKLYSRLFDTLKYIAKIDPLQFSVFVINQVSLLFQNGMSQPEHLQSSSERSNIVNTALSLIEVAANGLEATINELENNKNSNSEQNINKCIESASHIFSILIQYKCNNPEVIRIQLTKVEAFPFLIIYKPELILTSLTFLTNFLSKPSNSKHSKNSYTDIWTKVSYRSASVLKTLVKSNTNLFWNYYFDFVNLAKQHSTNPLTPDNTKIMLWELLISFFTSENSQNVPGQIPNATELNDLAVNLISPTINQFNELSLLLSSPTKLLDNLGVGFVGIDMNTKSQMPDILIKENAIYEFRSDLYQLLVTMYAFLKPVLELFDTAEQNNSDNNRTPSEGPIANENFALLVYLKLIQSVSPQVIKVALELIKVLHLIFNHKLLTQIVSTNPLETVNSNLASLSLNKWSEFLLLKCTPSPENFSAILNNDYSDPNKLFSSVVNILEVSNKIVGSLTFCPQIYYEIPDFGTLYSSSLFGEAGSLPLNVWKNIFLFCLKPLISANSKSSKLSYPLGESANNQKLSSKKSHIIKPPSPKQTSGVFSTFYEQLNTFLLDKISSLNQEFSKIHTSEEDVTEFESSYRHFMRSLSLVQSEIFRCINFGSNATNLSEFWSAEELIFTRINNKFKSPNSIRSANKALMGSASDEDDQPKYTASNMFDLLQTGSNNNFELKVDSDGSLLNDPKNHQDLNLNFLVYLVVNQSCSLSLLKTLIQMLNIRDLISTRNLIISAENVFPISLAYTIQFTKYQPLIASSSLSSSDIDNNFIEFLSISKQISASKIKKSLSTIPNSSVELFKFFSLISEFATSDLTSQLIRMLADSYYVELKDKIIHILSAIFSTAVSYQSQTQNSSSASNQTIDYTGANNHYWNNIKQSIINESMTMLKEKFNYQQLNTSLSSFYKEAFEYDVEIETDPIFSSAINGTNSADGSDKTKKNKFMYALTKTLLDHIINWHDSHDLLKAATKESNRIVASYKKSTNKSSIQVESSENSWGSYSVLDSKGSGGENGNEDFDLSHFIP